MAGAEKWKFLLLPALLVPIPILLKLLGGPDLAVFAAAGVASSAIASRGSGPTSVRLPGISP